MWEQAKALNISFILFSLEQWYINEGYLQQMCTYVYNSLHFTILCVYTRIIDVCKEYPKIHFSQWNRCVIPKGLKSERVVCLRAGSSRVKVVRLKSYIFTARMSSSNESASPPFYSLPLACMIIIVRISNIWKSEIKWILISMPKPDTPLIFLWIPIPIQLLNTFIITLLILLPNVRIPAFPQKYQTIEKTKSSNRGS